MDTLIAAGVGAVVTVVLFPLAGLAWNWQQAPMRMLREDVTAIRNRVEEFQPSSTAPSPSVAPKVSVRLKLIEFKQEGESIVPGLQMSIASAEQWVKAVSKFLSEYLLGVDAERFLTVGHGNAIQRLADRLAVLDELIERTPHEDA